MQDQQPRSTSTFDYVVVGTGAAGSIVAAACRKTQASPSAPWSPVRPTGTRTFICRRASSRHVPMKAYTWLQDQGRGRRQRVARHHPGRPHPRADRPRSTAYLQPRPAPGFRHLGAARQSRLGLSGRTALFQAAGASHRRRRRPIAAATAAFRSPTSTGRIRSRGLHGRRRRPRHSAQPRLQRRDPGGCGLLPALHPGRAAPQRPPTYSSRRQRNPGDGAAHPCARLARSCSRAGRRWRFVMSTSAARRSTR